MKKYILLIALTFIITSCSKDNKKYCWECIMTEKQIYPVEKPVKVLPPEFICDKTEYEIQLKTKAFTRIDTIKYYDNGIEKPDLLTVEDQKFTCTKK